MAIKTQVRRRNEQRNRGKTPTNQPERSKFDDKSNSIEKKGIWNWKPIRELTRIGMNKISCLFSVEVVTAQGLPSSMNGLRLSVCITKQETKDGAVQTMLARVSQGATDFEETLFLRCHVYCNGGQGKLLKFEPRPICIKGGELVVKVGFQIMEDGRIGIYNEREEMKTGKSGRYSSFARKQSKISFSVPSPRITTRMDAWTPSQTTAANDFQEIDDLNLDEPESVKDSLTSTQKLEDFKSKMEDVELPDFEVVDKGVEVQDEKGGEESDKSMEVNSDGSPRLSHSPQQIMHFPSLSSLSSTPGRGFGVNGQPSSPSPSPPSTSPDRLLHFNRTMLGYNRNYPEEMYRNGSRGG